MKDDIKGKSLLSRWKISEKKKSQSVGLVKAPSNEKLLPSHGQQRLWFLQHLYPKNPVYNYSEVYTFKGDLNPNFLRQSVQSIYTSNTILRTFFELVDGELICRIYPKGKVTIKEFDLSLLPFSEMTSRKSDLLMADASKHFDLDDPPLMRVTLIKISAIEWVLMVTMHHIITDKWSMGLFREQLGQNYRDLCATGTIQEGTSELQFSDYAYWQQSQTPEVAQMDYWKNKLSGDIPYLKLPTDHEFTGNNTFKGSSHMQSFSPELSEKLLNLSIQLGTTPYVLLLSVYYLMLYRYSGQQDILIGTPISMRKGKVLENMIGFFDETIVLRTKLSPGMGFPELVGKVNETTLEAFANKDVPFDLLVKELKPERTLGINPFFRGMFMYHAVPEKPSFGPEVEVDYTFLNSGVSKFDLTMYISNDHGLLSSSFEYSTDLFEKATILNFQEHFKILLENIVQHPKEKISGIMMLTDSEREVLLPKKTIENEIYTEFSGIHEIITAIGNKMPDHPAVTFKDNVITYRELLTKADKLAQDILQHSKGENEIVGLCMERSVEMIIGLLAILKAGCAYLPIDPEYPIERVSYMLTDSKVPLVITQNELADIFTEYKGGVIFADDLPSENSITIKLPEANREHLAYLIYTSGSTGKPKGVPISHGNIIFSTEGRLLFYPDNPDAFLLLSSISFDSSKAGIFWTLCAGGNLVIAEKRLEQDIAELGEVIYRNSVTHTLMLPSLYKTILNHSDISQLDSLKTVIVAGEECSLSTCVVHFKKMPAVALYNEYGPTEATVWCIAHRITEDQKNKAPIPIGKPVGYAEIYILNEEFQLVPIGAEGEIYIGGPLLAQGYLNDLERTAKSFIDHPFDKNSKKKVYKTGDLGRYNRKGEIEFLGRVDQQIKIRGFRVELEEIERVITEDPMIEEVAVIVRELGNGIEPMLDSDSPKQLMAYLQVGANYDLIALKRNLKRAIPEYMIPSVFIVVDEFPLLPNGKVNRTALLEIKAKEATENGKTLSGAPENEVQKVLLKIWEDVLNFSPIGIHDNFFEIGGDSILSIQFLEKAKSQGIALSPNQIFNYQTISQLAGYISNMDENKEEWNYLVTFQKFGSKKPVFCLHAGGGAYILLQKISRSYSRSPYIWDTGCRNLW